MMSLYYIPILVVSQITNFRICSVCLCIHSQQAGQSRLLCYETLLRTDIWPKHCADALQDIT